MTIRELDRLVGNESAIALVRSGIGDLFNSGAIDALRALGRPHRINGGKDHITMASEASWSCGWNDCLDALLYFETMYLNTEKSDAPTPRLDFGSIDRALQSGDLTKEEADAIRSGKPIKYTPSAYSNNIELPKRKGPNEP